jgi:hypothetical protein
MKQFTTNELLKYIDEQERNVFEAKTNVRNYYQPRKYKKEYLRCSRKIETAVKVLKKRLRRMSLDSLQVMLKHIETLWPWIAIRNELERRLDKDAQRTANN